MSSRRPSGPTLAGRTRRLSQKRESLGSSNSGLHTSPAVRLHSKKTNARQAAVQHRAERVQVLVKKFRLWVRISLILIRMFKKCTYSDRIDALSPYYTQMDSIDEASGMGIDKNHYIFFDPSDYKANRQMRMTQEGKRILKKPPEERTAEEICYVMIALRGMKLIAEYPVRMQQMLAEYCRFESYEPKRVVVKQDRKPEAFYFILYGTVIVAVLQDGGYAKTMLNLTRGHTFGELAITNRCERQSSIITKTYTEMLSICDEMYEKIFMVGGARNLSDPDQNEFLRSLSFLRGWPQECLAVQDPKLVTFGYFRRKTVIVRDSSFSDWIFIVKSGSITVVKKLLKTKSTINTRSGQQYVRANTDGYLNFQNNATAYGRYLSYNKITLPPPLSLRSDDDGNDAIDQSPLRHVARANRPHTSVRRIKTAPEMPVRVAWSAVHRSEGRSKERKQRRVGHVYGTLRRSKSCNAARVSSPGSTNEEENSTKNIRTYIDDLDARYFARKRALTEADMNPQFVFVQTLTKGEVFGLQQLLFENQPSLCLVSNGSECLMISKKFYMDNCSPALLRRLRIEVSPYPTDNKLQEDLKTRVNWEKYKLCLIKQLRERKQTKVFSTGVF